MFTSENKVPKTLFQKSGSILKEWKYIYMMLCILKDFRTVNFLERLTCNVALCGSNPDILWTISYKVPDASWRKK